MQAKYTLTNTESTNIRKMLEDIPVDLCSFVTCPGDGDCDHCPMLAVQNCWEEIVDQIDGKLLPELKKIEG